MPKGKKTPSARAALRTFDEVKGHIHEYFEISKPSGTDIVLFRAPAQGNRWAMRRTNRATGKVIGMGDMLIDCPVDTKAGDVARMVARAMAGLESWASNKADLSIGVKSVEFGPYTEIAFGSVVWLQIERLLEDTGATETVETRAQRDADYDRLVYDQSRDFAVKYRRNVKGMRAALIAHGSKHDCIIRDQLLAAVEKAQRSDLYFEDMYRGRKVDEGVVEAVKEIMRRVHGF